MHNNIHTTSCNILNSAATTRTVLTKNSSQDYSSSKHSRCKPKVGMSSINTQRYPYIQEVTLKPSTTNVHFNKTPFAEI